jgi:hypothetical protein
MTTLNNMQLNPDRDLNSIPEATEAEILALSLAASPEEPASIEQTPTTNPSPANPNQELNTIVASSLLSLLSIPILTKLRR